MRRMRQGCCSAACRKLAYRQHAEQRREALLERYREFYADAPFVRVLETPPTLKETVGSNYCDISLFTTPDQRRVVVISSIDNLLKGQSGNALQNLNLMFGLEQTLGLERPPLYP